VLDPVAAATEADLVLLAVSDGAIPDSAGELASGEVPSWSRRVVLHHAGALGLDVLRPLEQRGAAVGLLHPLQSLGDGPLAPSLLRGARARIEGVGRAHAAARRLARDLGMVPLRLPAPLSPEDRIIYHAAAAMVSNDLIALIDAGSGLLEKLGMKRSDAFEALAPLARGTVLQAEAQGLRSALTGPVVRGDVETVAAHLRALGRRRRGSERIHRLLSRQLLCLAEREESAPPPEAVRDLKRLLKPEHGGRK
jgi:predicted short-subunit dehydrogenase-like oxidoreductase (DUF2520 family)